MRHRLIALFGLFCIALLAAGPARAGTICVKDVAGLKTALSSYELQPDGSTLTIKLKQGTYAVGNQLAHMYGENSIGDVGLKLRGGYSNDTCTSRSVNPANTVIDLPERAALQQVFVGDHPPHAEDGGDRHVLRHELVRDLRARVRR